MEAWFWRGGIGVKMEVCFTYYFYFFSIYMPYMYANNYGLKYSENAKILNYYYNTYYSVYSRDMSDANPDKYVPEGEYYMSSLTDNFFYKEYIFSTYRNLPHNGFYIQIPDLKNLTVTEKKYYYETFLHFTLPIHPEVLDKLILKYNKEKYSFISITFFYYNKELLDSDFIIIIREILCTLSKYNKQINFIYNYCTELVVDIKNVKITDRTRPETIVEFLICINNSDDFILNIQKDLIQYNLEIKYIENELDFFYGNHLYSLEFVKDVYLRHIYHNFFVYQFQEDLIDYYMLGLHLNKMDTCQQMWNISCVNYELQEIAKKDYGIVYDVSKEQSKKIANETNYYFRNLDSNCIIYIKP